MYASYQPNSLIQSAKRHQPYIWRLHQVGENIKAFIEGADGNDLLINTPLSDRIFVRNDNDDLRGRDGDDRLFGEDGNDRLFGQSGNDLLAAGCGDYLMRCGGDGGNDIMIGGAGSDELDGGSDNDLLFSHDGNDTMTGGTGGDFLVFNVAVATGVDLITDFEVNIGHIRLDNSGFGSFNAVLAATTQDGIDTVIDLGAGDTVRLQNPGVNSLDAGDFVILSLKI